MNGQLRLVEASTAAQFKQAEALFQEYAQLVNQPACFQNFEQELAELASRYAHPKGCIFLAYSNEAIAGCCAVHLLSECNYSNACEMKRLYVKAQFRGTGIGRSLAEATIAYAQDAGYDHLLLDTLDEMETARELYHDLGFTEIEPYYHNPILGAHYLMVQLRS